MAGIPGKDPRPIVVKRIKKVAHGHHGGAWKIAYADFVTAMMAFFLLMWLLGSTTKGDLQGIAEYFRTPLKVSLMGGSGSGDSTSVIQGGGDDIRKRAGQVKKGVESDTDPQTKRANDGRRAREEAEALERAKLSELKAKVESILDNNPKLAGFRGQIRLDITSEGLRIQIVDDQNRAMFDTGSARLKDYARDILRDLGHVLNEVDHRIALSGHTDATPYGGGERGYSNWELSSDRANASRRELLAAGLDEGKILRVLGLAASVPLVRDNPQDATNRRISIVVLNKRTEQNMLRDGATLGVSDAQESGAAEAPARRATERQDNLPIQGK